MTEPREEFQKLMRAYAAFQTATALFVVARSADAHFAGFIVFLFAISIPSTVAYAGFARVIPDDEKRNPPAVMAVCFTFAFFPSIAAISLLFAAASPVAAIAFPFTCVTWFVVIVLVRRRQQISLSRHQVE